MYRVALTQVGRVTGPSTARPSLSASFSSSSAAASSLADAWDGPSTNSFTDAWDPSQKDQEFEAWSAVRVAPSPPTSPSVEREASRAEQVRSFSLLRGTSSFVEPFAAPNAKAVEERTEHIRSFSLLRGRYEMSKASFSSSAAAAVVEPFAPPHWTSKTGTR